MSTHPDNIPCDHPGCLSHVSQPCEGCGRSYQDVSGLWFGPTPPRFATLETAEEYMRTGDKSLCVDPESPEYETAPYQHSFVSIVQP